METKASKCKRSSSDSLTDAASISLEKTGAVALSRRRFLQTTLSLSALIVLPACTSESSSQSSSLVSRAFFSADEYRFIEAMTARLIPGSADDPGALEASVPFFIDLQLAGPYGRAERWYMEGPWEAGTEQQGYQLEQTPAQMYRHAIAGLETYCRDRFDGKGYADLTPEDQDQVLRDMDEHKIELDQFNAQAFFAVLWQNAVEGFLSDPMYGGNRNFVGWKLIGFPGPRYNYVDEITEYGEPYPLPPVGLLGRDGSRVGV